MVYVALKKEGESVVSIAPIRRCSCCKLISHKFEVPFEHDNPFYLSLKRIQCAICGKILNGEIPYKKKQRTIIQKEVYEEIRKRFEDFEKLGKKSFFEKYDSAISKATYG